MKKLHLLHSAIFIFFFGAVSAQMPKMMTKPSIPLNMRSHADCKDFAIAHQGIKDSSLLLRKNERLVLPANFPPPMEGVGTCGCITNTHTVYYVTDYKPNIIFQYYKEKLVLLRYTFDNVIKSDDGKLMMMRYLCKEGSGYISVYLDKTAYSITYQPVSHECHCKTSSPQK